MGTVLLMFVFLGLAAAMAWRHARTDDAAWQTQLKAGIAVSVVAAGVIAARAVL